MTLPDPFFQPDWIHAQIIFPAGFADQGFSIQFGLKVLILIMTSGKLRHL